ncbi:MAG TPA: response regulator [Ferruginibacter sp.]|nr:response regulator [Ferruginibacter sp.]HNG62101.1 response regulator [Ferruginibacter sp.]HNL64354.1 response regulator [Ferruginibacter sp.]HNN69885.1 response regulator [Ferruginibacter sp.]HNO98227.1 response regulator [Ferruginibacter sp.]
MKHLLLIEDNDEIRDNTAEILELAGYKVTTAENGKVGVEKAIQEKPDLIICDIMMPVLDGYGVLHLLNKNPELTGIPFIFLTAKAERSDLRKGMEMGADDYITKPFSDVELMNAIESRLKKTEIVARNYSTDAEGMHQMLNDFRGDNALKELAADRHINHYKKKQVVYSEGNHPNRLYHIQKGKVKTFKTNDTGKELTVGLYNEGDFFGYTALLEETVYKETAEAIEDCDIAIVPKEEFENLLHSNKEVTHKFIKMLAKNISEKENQLLGLAYNSLRKRVADALLTLQSKYQKENQERFSMHISREDLANIAGTATESLIRTLSDFKSEKLIEISEGNIIITNQKKLAAMLN